MNGTDSDLVVVAINGTLTPAAFAKQLKGRTSTGAFRLVLDVADETDVTMPMAQTWLQAALDPEVPLAAIAIVSNVMRTRVLGQAIALAVRHRGSTLRIEVFSGAEAALRWPGDGQTGEEERRALGAVMQGGQASARL